MTEKPSRHRSQDKTSESHTATAYHEAGHAVMAYALGRLVDKVTVSPAQIQTGGFRLGACKMQKGRSKPSRDYLEDEVLILFAGMVGESHYTQQYCQAGAAQDLQAVKRLLKTRAPRERQLQRLAQRLLDKTEHLLNDQVNRRAIAMIANELLKKETISGRAVRHLLQEAARD